MNLLLRKFEERCVPDPSCGCWLWTGTIDAYGYGSMFLARTGNIRTIQKAHRLSWELHYGPIPDGLCVLHKCDVRSCVNPQHLFLGTPSQNVEDCISKGRAPFVIAPGRKNWAAKLQEEDIAKILSDQRTQAMIAIDFGVCQQQISRIKNKKAWKVLQ